MENLEQFNAARPDWILLYCVDRVADVEGEDEARVHINLFSTVGLVVDGLRRRNFMVFIFRNSSGSFKGHDLRRLSVVARDDSK